jgi:hypothetical protein
MAFSSESALGVIGVMTTAGEVIASAVVAEDAMPADVDSAADAAVG